MSLNDKKLPALFQSERGPITESDHRTALCKLGLVRGDLVMLHADVSTFGKLGDFRDRNAFLQALLDGFVDVLGPEGTLIVPTYTYSFCKNQPFDVKSSPSTTGIFSEYVRTRPNAVRSADPIFSHAGLGPKAAMLLNDVGTTCFGKESVFDRFYNQNGKIVNFGKFFDITYLHYIEHEYQLRFGKLSYRKNKTFSGTIINSDGISRHSEFTYYVRRLADEQLDVQYQMPKLAEELRRRSLLGATMLGNNEILCSTARDCLEVGFQMLDQDIYAFLAKKPN